jgi:2-polyprenyl-3-methyl-5-hydroxy-6-metoxy-1,4-benzoquinol methylase
MNLESPLLELQHTLYGSRNPTRRWLHGARREWIVSAIQRYGGLKPGRALEVGPGSGVYLPVLADLFREVTAADVEPSFLHQARAIATHYTNLQVQVDDIMRSRLVPASFDLILCTEVIEHIADSAAALATMRSLLAPGGHLILSTPQRYSPLEVAAKVAFLPGIIDVVRWIYREPILETGHINLLTERQVRAQLDDAGFDVREQYKSGLYLPLIAEFGGRGGMRLEQRLERRLRGTGLDWLLWTQYYVACAS